MLSVCSYFRNSNRKEQIKTNKFPSLRFIISTDSFFDSSLLYKVVSKTKVVESSIAREILSENI